MPVSSNANGAFAAALVSVSNGRNADETRRSRQLTQPIGWLNMMRASDVDVRLERFRGSSGGNNSTAAATTAAAAAAATTPGNATTTTTMTTTTIMTTTTTKEEATSRERVEGQLPSTLNANSCLSCHCCCCCCCCCDGDIVETCATEMAQEDYPGPSWNNLPSVILREIFSYLPHDARIRASQVCRNWRYALFHPSFWRKITFMLYDEDSVFWTRFLADCFSLSVHQVTIRWDLTSDRTNVDRRYMSETYNLLKKLSCNRQLRGLFLEFSGHVYDYTFDSEDDGLYAFFVSLTECLLKLIETSNHLEVLSLGCTEELAANASIILEPLRLHHAKHLTHLSLASIKDDPDYYDAFELDNSIFNSFIRLSILTLDYDFVSDTLLKALDNGCMQRLVIHVHGWKEDHPGTTDVAWQIFVQKNPQCELRINLIHSYVGVKVLDTDILCYSMPLTHLKVLFCENVNIRALLRISVWFSHTLRSLTWIDSKNHKQRVPPTFDPSDPNSPDPMVLLAWKCTKLTKMVFLGHKYYQENLLAIARLRGNTLKLLVFAKSDITCEYETWYKASNEAITHEIQQIMGLHWMPLSDSDLPTVILDPFKGDSRDVITPLVLSDQK